MSQHTAGALGQLLPRHQIAVVLHHREQHLITGLQFGISPGAGHQIDGLTGVAREHDLARAGCSHELRRDQPGSFKGFSGPSAELMGTTMHIGVVAAVVVTQRIQHSQGLLTGRRMIEVNQWLPRRRLLRQNRKISTCSLRNRYGCVATQRRRHELRPSRS